MGKEGKRPTSGEFLRGEPLKEAVRFHMQQRIKRYSDEGSIYLPLVEGLANNLDVIDPNWDNPVHKSSVISSIGSFCASFHYAHIKAGTDKLNKFLTLFTNPISSEDKWRGIIEDTMADPAMKEEFQKNAWRPPSTLFHERGIPLQYILAHRFGEKPVAIVDLGTGLHTSAPLLNTEWYTKPDFPGKNNIQHLLDHKVNVTYGLGVDMQKIDPDWSMASIWPVEGGIDQLINFTGLGMTVEGSRGTAKFPFALGDVRNPLMFEAMQDFMEQKYHNRNAQVVISSFLRQFIGNDPDLQQQFVDNVRDTLDVGGIWIDIGAENLESYDGKKGSKVEVYEKQEDGELVHIGTPFTLRDQIYIDSVDLSYFGVAA